MSNYPSSVWERAMKVQEVILKAISGEITWIRAADVLGMSARSLRRCKHRYQTEGYDGLLDHRTGRPSPKRASLVELQKVLQLYRNQYDGFNVRHFHQKAREEHGVKFSYTFVKKALQEAGYVKKGRKRGPHRMRREPKECFGQMLHTDGSKHAWLALVPEEQQTLITVQDDATGRLLYAQLWPGESTEAILSAFWDVVEKYGIAMSLYSDRAGWAFHTPKAGGQVDKDKLTQVGVALAKLGVEHIPAYSPQARGRSERLNRTLQDRLINEMRVADIRTMKAANRYLREVFIPDFNRRFSRAPRSPENLFVQAKGVDLDQVFCHEEGRVVAKDNTVVFGKLHLQIEKQPGKSTCAGLRVVVRHHLDGRYTVWNRMQLLGTYDPKGRLVTKPIRKVAETSLRATPFASFPQPSEYLQ